jgi:hypothetical protein
VVIELALCALILADTPGRVPLSHFLAGRRADILANDE